MTNSQSTTALRYPIAERPITHTHRPVLSTDAPHFQPGLDAVMGNAQRLKAIADKCINAKLSPGPHMINGGSGCGALLKQASSTQWLTR
jgi:hypothetical protein